MVSAAYLADARSLNSWTNPAETPAETFRSIARPERVDVKVLVGSFHQIAKLSPRFKPAVLIRNPKRLPLVDSANRHRMQQRPGCF